MSGFAIDIIDAGRNAVILRGIGADVVSDGLHVWVSKTSDSMQLATAELVRINERLVTLSDGLARESLICRDDIADANQTLADLRSLAGPPRRPAPFDRVNVGADEMSFLAPDGLMYELSYHEIASLGLTDDHHLVLVLRGGEQLPLRRHSYADELRRAEAFRWTARADAYIQWRNGRGLQAQPD